MRGLLLSLCLVAAASATVFQDCGSLGSDVSLDVPGCEVPPCIFVRGTTTDVVIEFTASADSDTLTIHAYASINGVDLPWEDIDPNGCNHTTCPIVANTVVDYNMPIPIPAEYPAISTVATFKLINSAGADEVCITLPVTLV